MARTVTEWIGKTDDAMPHKAVRERIWDKFKGCCHICGGPITQKRWHADHLKPLKDGGENRETNLAPAHELCHGAKTAKENRARAKVTRQKQKFVGIKAPKQAIPSRPFPEPVREKAAPSKRRLPPRLIYKEPNR